MILGETLAIALFEGIIASMKSFPISSISYLPGTSFYMTDNQIGVIQIDFVKKLNQLAISRSVQVFGTVDEAIESILAKC